MVREDGTSPVQFFFDRFKSKSLNPNAIAFNPEKLISRRDMLHEKQCELWDQHLLIIKDLVSDEEVMIQDYLTGLWSESATVISKREDRCSYWVKDTNGMGI